MAVKTHPCQYRREPTGRKRSAATKMSAMRQRRRNCVLRLRGVDIGRVAYANNKERVAESGSSNSWRGAEADERGQSQRVHRLKSMLLLPGFWVEVAR